MPYFLTMVVLNTDRSSVSFSIQVYPFANMLMSSRSGRTLQKCNMINIGIKITKSPSLLESTVSLKLYNLLKSTNMFVQ